MAKQVEARGYSAPQLYAPARKPRAPAPLLRILVDKYNGQFRYALAAYNAGTDRVEDWLGQGNCRVHKSSPSNPSPSPKPPEYVQAILRNASVYRQLYGTP